MEKEVVVLRRFRDSYLVTNRLGQTVVNLYYRLSPPLANRIEDNEIARAVCRLLLAPVVWFCWLTLTLSGASRLAWLLVIVSAFLLIRKRHVALRRNV
jgi:hypothetical protein